ncbi:MAG: DUF4145 domain-containing protein [Microgenomates group bacterium]
MANSNFVCKYCSHHSTITSPDQFSHWEHINTNESTLGQVGFNIHAISCPNPECRKLTLRATLTDALNNQATQWNWQPKNIHENWQLLPESEAQVLPIYIPKPIRQDYYEACRIRDLSPKASATLARRCLQGMIRDFFGVSKSRLKDEIDAIEPKVDVDVFAAINAVRSVGNIGAHMEKDIDLIVDVDPNEAQLLIELIEQLIEDWYVVRKAKQDRLSKITALAKLKKQDKEKAKK